MTAIDSKLFVESGLRFRAHILQEWSLSAEEKNANSSWSQLVEDIEYQEADCPGSECSLLARDIWHLRNMKAKIAVIPYARSTYHYKSWPRVRDETPFSNGDGQELYRLSLNFKAHMSEAIDWTTIQAPPSVACKSNRDDAGNLIEPWDNLGWVKP